MIVRTEPKYVVRVGDGTPVKERQLFKGKGTLRSVFFANLGAGTVYVQFHDSASAPADGAVPAYPDIPLAAGQSGGEDTPRSFVNGCYICASDTQATKTLIAADEAQFVAESV